MENKNRVYTLRSKEGWNFDYLGENVKQWNRLGCKSCWISETLESEELGQYRLVKSYDRIVGLCSYELNSLITLGWWSNTTTRQLSDIARANEMDLVKLVNVENIDMVEFVISLLEE